MYIIEFILLRISSQTSVREDHLLAREALVSARVVSYLLHKELENLAADISYSLQNCYVGVKGGIPGS